MRPAVVIDAIRTPIGKASAENGIYRDFRADDLSAHVMQQLVERTGIDPHLIEDVRWGCVQQQGEQGFDIARNAALIADLPIEVGGVTVNLRGCGDGGARGGSALNRHRATGGTRSDAIVRRNARSMSSLRPARVSIERSLSRRRRARLRPD